MRYVVLDTETTGLNVDDGHRVIEIGCVEIENRSLTGQEYHQKINPVREVDKGAEEIHGMNAAQLKETTLNPQARVLLRVDIESQLEADSTFHQLLGKDASERYKVIMEDACFADDIDL